MLRSAKLSIASVALLATAACWHATIETGLPAGNETIENAWAMSFVYGLIPPATVSTAARCRSGVARVETQHSFLNGLVAAVTFSIVTPMTIKVTCAAAHAQNANTTTQLAVRGEATPAVIQAVFASAAAAAAAAPGGVAFVSFMPAAPQQ